MIAISSYCIEVHHLATGSLVQIMSFPAVRHLNPHESSDPTRPCIVQLHTLGAAVPVIAELIVKDEMPIRIKEIEGAKGKCVGKVG